MDVSPELMLPADATRASKTAARRLRGTRSASLRALRSVARAVALATLVAALGVVAFAQSSEPRVTARLSTGVAKLGESIVLQLVAENVADATIAELPAVPGLQLGRFGSPSRQSSTTFAGGRVVQYQAVTWNAAVRPEQTGEFTIPPIQVRVGAKVYASAPLSLTVVADLQGGDLGFIQVLPSSSRVIDGQPFSVEVRFGWDTRKSRFNYAILSLPWWRQLEGTVENPTPALARTPEDVYVFVDDQPLGGFEELEPTTIRGASFRTFRCVKSFTPTRAGKLELSTSSLEFGRVVAREDFFMRSSLERVEQFFARGEPVSIDVVPLPENGRPFDFGGAVGRFDVKAGAEPRDVTVGDSIKFKVEWSGSGNLEFFEAPAPERQDAFKGFRVYGKTETKSVDRRVVEYDLAPIDPALQAIPPLEMPVFDPETMRYERLATLPITIHVRPLAGATGLASEGAAQQSARDLIDIDARATPGSQLPEVPGPLLLGALVLVPACGLFVRASVRRRGDPDAPAEKRRRRAKKTLERELAHAADPRARFDAFCEFLGARTKESREAWIGRRRAQGVALDPALETELVRLLEELERAAWSGERRDVDAAQLNSLAERLIRGGL
ncbi:MAG: BatD family protein [Planctomycetes bacterium]|nr:BatD family protein [Planctomycetota bacterium]